MSTKDSVSITASPSNAPRQCITIRPDRETLTRQRLPYFVCISETTAGTKAGTKGPYMHLVVIPLGAAAQPHCHRDFETAICVLEGRVETRYGPVMPQSVVNGPGDFLFIPLICTSRLST